MSGDEQDWNAEWTRLSARRERDHDAAFWDRRARQYRGGEEDSPYVSGFLAFTDARPGESVLDVACGTGALALPLARAGHPVVGLDFSAGMLDVLRRRAAEEGLDNVRTVQAAWGDDWSAAGVAPADIAIASRALDVDDLRAALGKLEQFARRRVCVTVPARGLLYPSLLAHAAVARPLVPRGDGETAVGVLRQMGVEPEVRELEHTSAGRYESPDAAADALRRMIRPRDSGEEQALERYVAGHLVEQPGREWALEPEVTVPWTFLAWDKQV
jgi:SAM-dependent methyltransferase